MDLRDPDILDEKLFHQFLLTKHKMSHSGTKDTFGEGDTMCSLEGLVDEGINARF